MKYGNPDLIELQNTIDRAEHLFREIGSQLDDAEADDDLLMARRLILGLEAIAVRAYQWGNRTRSEAMAELERSLMGLPVDRGVSREEDRGPSVDDPHEVAGMHRDVF